jgi:peptidoglycan/xylan/chitin deacetylase (PgdA/CDA1 family)
MMAAGRSRGRRLPRLADVGCVALGCALVALAMAGCQGSVPGGSIDSGAAGSAHVGAGGSPGTSAGVGGSGVAGRSGAAGMSGAAGTGAGGSGTGGAAGGASGGGRDAGAADGAAGRANSDAGMTADMGGGAGGATGGGNGGAAGGPPCPPSGFAWPNGAQAAASLTYDDTLTSQLDNAMPVLDRLGLKMTYFLITNQLGSAALRARYADALASGHELASHSVSHPCADTTPTFTLATFASGELDPSIATLRAIGVTGPLTYAYPCGTTTVGTNTSYIPLVTARFIAARGVVGVVADPRTVDLGNTPGYFPASTDTTGAAAIGMVTQARQRGGWIVFGFHGVGGDYLITPQSGHDALAQYLADNKASVWTATFGEVASYIARCR